MYKQLLTYEIRAQVRSDVRILAALVAVVAASIGVRALDIPGLSTSTEMLAYALCVAMPLVVAIMGLVDYWKTLYGQRGYFTMSLPASGLPGRFAFHGGWVGCHGRHICLDAGA